MSRRSRILTLALTAGLLVLAVWFGAFRLSTAIGGAFIQPDNSPFAPPDGVVLTPFSSGELRDGDVVIGVAGRPMADWTRLLADTTVARPVWRAGETLTYRIHRQGQELDVPVTLMPYSLDAFVARNLPMVGFWLPMLFVSVFLVLRRPGEPAAWALLVHAAALINSALSSRGLHVGDWVTGIGFWAYHVEMVAGYLFLNFGLIAFVLLFPQPHPLIRRHGRAVLSAAIAFVLIRAAVAAVVWSGSGSPLDRLAQSWAVEYGFNGVMIAVVAVAAVANFRIAARDAVARQQAEWVILALLVLATGILLLVVPGAFGLPPIIPVSLLSLLFNVIPISIAIAMVRHNLFDVDLVLNRALVYGPLVALLALAYFGIIVALQQLIRPIVGEGSDLAIVGSTLAIYALLNPLRTRIQAFVDRRFYRQKYDATQTLDVFAWTIRDEVDLGQLKQKLSAMVADTMQTEKVSVWLRT